MAKGFDLGNNGLPLVDTGQLSHSILKRNREFMSRAPGYLPQVFVNGAPLDGVTRVTMTHEPGLLGDMHFGAETPRMMIEIDDRAAISRARFEEGVREVHAQLEIGGERYEFHADKEHLCPPDFPLEELQGEGYAIARDWWEEAGDETRARWCRELYERNWRTDDPPASGWYLATFGEGDRKMVGELRYEAGVRPHWFQLVEPKMNRPITNVIAWMPLPKPYEPPNAQ